MLINCSNHPSSLWGPSQVEAAKAYGEIFDIPYPQVDPWLDTNGIRKLVDEYVVKIENLNPDAVFLAGEFTFLFMLTDKLLKDGIHVISACSMRDTSEVLRSDGSTEKRTTFVFKQFRDYSYY